jgi:biopolymer transport protein ExbD
LNFALFCLAKRIEEICFLSFICKGVLVVKNVNKASVLVLIAILLFVFGCEREAGKIRIKIEPDAIFVDEEEIAKTTAVAKQDTLLIEALDIVLKNKREVEKAEFLKANKKFEEQVSLVLVQIAPNIEFNVLFKITATSGASGYTNVHFTSKINGKNYTEIINLPERSDMFGDNRQPCQDYGVRGMAAMLTGIKEVLPEPSENCLKLTLAISKEYFEIWAGGNSLPKIPIVNPIDSSYGELAKTLDSIRNRFIDSEDNDKIVILADDDMKISNIIQAMHIAGTVGFSKKNLSKFAKPTQQTKEKSIRIDKKLKTRQRIIDSLFNLGLDSSSLAKLYIENGIVPYFGEDTNAALNFAKYLIKMKFQHDSIRKENIKNDGR